MSANPLAPLVEVLYGPFYLGAVMSTAFYGVTCMQIFFYYVRYQDDPLYIKIFVAVLWALDTVHEALSVSGAYKLAIAGLVNPLSFVSGLSQLISTYLVTVLVALPTQGFFVYRIYIVSGRNLIAPVVWVSLAFLQLVCVTTYVGKAVYTANNIHNSGISLINTGIFATLGTVSLSVGAGVDVLIAICMTFLLFRERTTTRIRSTAHILQRLTVYAVNTGTWTALFALLTVIILHLLPTKTYHAIFVIPLGSLYCNTLLANLNVRTYVRNELPEHVGMSLVARQDSHVPDRTEGHKQAESAISVHETTTKMVAFPNTNRLSF